jgi:hypothetical protein
MQLKNKKREEHKNYYKYFAVIILDLEAYLKEFTDERIGKVIINKVHRRLWLNRTDGLIKSINRVSLDVIFHDVIIHFNLAKLNLTEIRDIILTEDEEAFDDSDSELAAKLLKSHRILLSESYNAVNNKLRDSKKVLKIKE